ncbi:MAG: methyltransferase domain-containing protein [Magnetococcus sp. DMHC-1]|nr:methyltransferase domain-containing protein [Magnetococcales bacterium]
MESLLAKFKKNGQVYIDPEEYCSDYAWRIFQEREKAFWKQKITKTEYHPDPAANFSPFLVHWNIDPTFFRHKTVMEIGTGPFGFFSGLKKIDPSSLPSTLILMDSLMDFYQQFSLFNLMPESSIRLQGRCEKIPLPDNFFDVILTTNTIDHVGDYQAFLQEIVRVLRPGGHLLFSVHFVAGWATLIKFLLPLIDKNHPYHFRVNDVRTMLQNSGLRLIRESIMPMYLEETIPQESGIFRRIMYSVGFRVMHTFYGVAKTPD